MEIVHRKMLEAQTAHSDGMTYFPQTVSLRQTLDLTLHFPAPVITPHPLGRRSPGPAVANHVPILCPCTLVMIALNCTSPNFVGHREIEPMSPGQYIFAGVVSHKVDHKCPNMEDKNIPHIYILFQGCGFPAANQSISVTSNVIIM